MFLSVINEVKCFCGHVCYVLYCVNVKKSFMTLLQYISETSGERKNLLAIFERFFRVSFATFITIFRLCTILEVMEMQQISLIMVFLHHWFVLKVVELSSKQFQLPATFHSKVAIFFQDKAKPYKLFFPSDSASFLRMMWRTSWSTWRPPGSIGAGSFFCPPTWTL